MRVTEMFAIIFVVLIDTVYRLAIFVASIQLTVSTSNKNWLWLLALLLIAPNHKVNYPERSEVICNEDEGQSLWKIRKQ